MSDIANLWRHRDFLKLWGGQTISQIGSHISREGLPLTAVLVLGATPLQIGVLNGAGGASVLLFGLFAGVWVDRLRRRPLLISTDLIRAVLLATVPIAALLHRLTMAHLCMLAAADGVLATLFEVAYRSYIPSLVGPAAILEANSKLALTESASEVVGPGLTGVLVQLLTAPIAIAFDAVSFLASMLSVAAIRTPEPHPAKPLETPRILDEIRDGLAVCWSDRRLRALLLRTAMGAFFMGFVSLYILFVVRDLHLNPAQLGLVVSIGGATNLLGALLAPRAIRALGFGAAMIVSQVALGLAALIPTLARGPVATCCLILSVAQLGDIAWPILNICDRTLCQTTAPAHLLGRVNAAMHLMFRGVLPAGALVGGVVASTIGVRTTMAAGAMGFLLATLFIVLSPIRSMVVPPPS